MKKFIILALFSAFALVIGSAFESIEKQKERTEQVSPSDLSDLGATIQVVDLQSFDLAFHIAEANVLKPIEGLPERSTNSYSLFKEAYKPDKARSGSYLNTLTSPSCQPDNSFSMVYRS